MFPKKSSGTILLVSFSIFCKPLRNKELTSGERPQGRGLAWKLFKRKINCLQQIRPDHNSKEHTIEAHRKGPYLRTHYIQVKAKPSWTIWISKIIFYPADGVGGRAGAGSCPVFVLMHMSEIFGIILRSRDHGEAGRGGGQRLDNGRKQDR